MMTKDPSQRGASLSLLVSVRPGITTARTAVLTVPWRLADAILVFSLVVCSARNYEPRIRQFRQYPRWLRDGMLVLSLAASHYDLGEPQFRRFP